MRTATVGVLAYVGLMLLLRLAGKRTLSEMNAFDRVVTVAPLLFYGETPLHDSLRRARLKSPRATVFMTLTLPWTCV